MAGPLSLGLAVLALLMAGWALRERQRSSGTAGEPALGKPRVLFTDDYALGTGISIANYDITAEGRFVMLAQDPSRGRLHIVFNWTEELKRILAQGGVR